MLHQPFIVPAVLIGLLSLPLLLRLVPRNGFYGIRTRKTLGDDRVWYATNRLGGGSMLVASGAYLFFSLLQPMNGGHDPRFGLWLAHLAVFAVPQVVGLLVTLRHSRRLE